MSERSPERSGKPVVLVGFMAAGKSRIGRLLAQRLDVDFIDTDEAIEDLFGMPIGRIFQVHGEPAFRKAERGLIEGLLGAGEKVIAVGGGAFVDARTRKHLNESARTVWLDTPIDILLERIARSTSRPLASVRTEEELRELWEQRRSSYASAEIRIETADGDPGVFAERIASILA